MSYHPFYILLLFCCLPNFLGAQDFHVATKKPLDHNINTRYHESTPVLSPDEQTLYVTRIGHPENMGGETADIWQSQKQADGTWGLLQNLGAPLNNDGPNSLLALSDDGQTAWLSNQYAPDGSLNNAGLSYSQKTSSGWSMPVATSIENFYLNSGYATYAVASDGSVLIMGVERDDSQGALDLYVSFRVNKNTWSKPENMSSTLNTQANEFAASLSPDNSMLYFVSEGHSGYGTADLFVSQRLNDSWTSWSKPMNLGSTINSSNWDSFLCLGKEEAYMVSQAAANQSLDLYEITLPDFAKPQLHRTIVGEVINANTKQGMNALIRINEETFKEAEEGTGKFKFSLLPGQDHHLVFERRGYFSVQEKIKAASGDLRLIIQMVPLESGQEISLKNVHFEANNTSILSESMSELAQLLHIMQVHPNMKIEITGHTSGHTDELQLLSEQRAEAIRDFLSSRGIAARRIQTVGHGGLIPIASNETEADKKRNRRVTFKVLSMD